MANDSEVILVERRGAVAVMYLNRPDVMNAVNEEMTDDFEAGEGDDVGEAASHELPSAITSWIDAARHHRTFANGKIHIRINSDITIACNIQVNPINIFRIGWICVII